MNPAISFEPSAPRRLICAAPIALAIAPIALRANAAGLEGVSNGDMLGALRTALTQGADTAVNQLGKPGGFFNDPTRRIPLPGVLGSSEKFLRMAGKGQELDRLHRAINEAAERAVPKARPLLSQAIKSMRVDDARKIISGGDHSVTDYFRGKTESALSSEFKPVVTKQVAGLGVARQYDALAGKGSKLGLIKGDASSMDSYVTAKAIDALYAMIAEKEREIRRNPLGAGSAILGKVFGALK